METHARTKMPLTVRFAQGPPPRRKMDRSKQRTYGRQGHTAASRALLKENFIDENEIEDDLVRLTIADPNFPECSQQDSQETTTSREQKVKSRAAFIQKIEKYHKGALNDPKFVEYIQPLLLEAGSNDVVDFKAWANRLTKKFRVLKLAEGSFGEVYMLREKGSGVTATSQLESHGGCIFKIVPLHGEHYSKDRTATSIDAIIRESKLLKTMDPVPGFTRFRKLHVLQGRYADSFIEAFRDFKEEGKPSTNEDPQRFSPTQLFAVIEMDDAGTDLDSLRSPSVFQVHDIFWSVVILLANAEEQVEFEHRDLHIGNICIKPRMVGGSMDISTDLISNMEAAPASLLGLSDIRTTIIDYTLSRAAVGPEKTEIIFDPFRDAAMFKAHSRDLEEKRQFDNYRHMNKLMIAAYLAVRGTGPSPKKNQKQVALWARFVPKTNVVWLSYILYVLLLRAGGKILASSNEAAEALQEQMYEKLEDVMVELDAAVEDLPSSARMLLALAQARGWLVEEDVRGFKEQLEQEA